MKPQKPLSECCAFLFAFGKTCWRGKYNYLHFRWKPEEQEAGLGSESTQEFRSGGLTKKHGSNLWYENGWWWCLFPLKGYGECRNWVLDFCTMVWFVSSLNAAGPSSALLLILTGSQQDTDEIRSGAPKAQLEKPCCAELLAQLCQCLWGLILPDLLHAMRFTPACLPTCEVQWL